jgi:cystine transport system substrate-binding protein
MIAGLDAGRFDVIANQVAVTDERKQKYEFSNPYIFIHGVLLTSKANNQIKTFTDLKGKKAAQTLTSNWGKTSEKYGATLVGVDGFEQSAELIQAGRADATINAEVAFLDYLKKKPNADLKVVATTKEAIVCALPIKKGNAELVKDINKALAELQVRRHFDQAVPEIFWQGCVQELSKALGSTGGYLWKTGWLLYCCSLLPRFLVPGLLVTIPLTVVSFIAGDSG